MMLWWSGRRQPAAPPELTLPSAFRCSFSTKDDLHVTLCAPCTSRRSRDRPLGSAIIGDRADRVVRIAPRHTALLTSGSAIMGCRSGRDRRRPRRNISAFSSGRAAAERRISVMRASAWRSGPESLGGAVHALSIMIWMRDSAISSDLDQRLVLTDADRGLGLISAVQSVKR